MMINHLARRSNGLLAIGLILSVVLTLAPGPAARIALAKEAPKSPKNQPKLITKLKTLHLATPIVSDGQPLAKLVVPQGNAALRAVAEKIRQRVAEHTGAQLSIVEASDSIDFRAPPETHLIAVGCFADNPLLRVLYYQFYTLVDRWYPGKGGYALHTVHDPWETAEQVAGKC